MISARIDTLFVVKKTSPSQNQIVMTSEPCRPLCFFQAGHETSERKYLRKRIRVPWTSVLMYSQKREQKKAKHSLLLIYFVFELQHRLTIH